MVLDNLFNLMMIMGAILSFLLSLYLIFYPSRFFPNRILGALVFSWAITAFGFIVQSPDFFDRFPHVYASIDVFALLFFPLMYLYIRYYLYSDIKSTSKVLLHFVPAIAYLIAFMPFFIVGGEEKAYMIKNGVPSWFRPMQTVFNVAIIVQGIFYSIFSLRVLHHFQYFRKKRLSLLQLNSLSWLKIFVVINIFLWMLGTTGVVLDILGIRIFIDLFKLFYFGLTMLTVVLSVFSIQRPELFSEKEDIASFISSVTNVGKKESSTPNMSSDFEILSEYFKTEKPFLKNDLKMQDLVEATGLSYKRISEIFNNEYKKTFYDVVNEMRLGEAIRLLKENFHERHTLPYLAETAGFNSKTTFNRTFKKITGKTPTEFIQELKVGSDSSGNPS